jgi:long-chain acyl-CoA synthetase
MLLIGDAVEGPVKLPDLLGVGLANQPDEVALLSTALRMTWREIAAVSDRLAKNLLGLGLAPGDRVASLVPNRIALLVHYLACMSAGLVAVPSSAIPAGAPRSPRLRPSP